MSDERPAITPDKNLVAEFEQLLIDRGTPLVDEERVTQLSVYEWPLDPDFESKFPKFTRLLKSGRSFQFETETRYEGFDPLFQKGILVFWKTRDNKTLAWDLHPGGRVARNASQRGKVSQGGIFYRCVGGFRQYRNKRRLIGNLHSPNELPKWTLFFEAPFTVQERGEFREGWEETVRFALMGHELAQRLEFIFDIGARESEFILWDTTDDSVYYFSHEADQMSRFGVSVTPLHRDKLFRIEGIRSFQDAVEPVAQHVLEQL